jgi:hypothetical protein
MVIRRRFVIKELVASSVRKRALFSALFGLMRALGARGNAGHLL